MENGMVPVPPPNSTLMWTDDTVSASMTLTLPHGAKPLYESVPARETSRLIGSVLGEWAARSHRRRCRSTYSRSNPEKPFGKVRLRGMTGPKPLEQLG